MSRTDIASSGGRPGRQARRTCEADPSARLVLVLVAWLALAGVGGPLVGRLSEVQKNDNATSCPRLPSRPRSATLVAKLQLNQVAAVLRRRSSAPTRAVDPRTRAPCRTSSPVSRPCPSRPRSYALGRLPRRRPPDRPRSRARTARPPGRRAARRHEGRRDDRRPPARCSRAPKALRGRRRQHAGSGRARRATSPAPGGSRRLRRRPSAGSTASCSSSRSASCSSSCSSSTAARSCRFAVLFTRRLRAEPPQRWSIYPLAKNDVIALTGSSQGILFDPRRRRRHRLRAAARQPLSRRSCTTSRARGWRMSSGLARRRSSRSSRQRGHRHPRPALPAARRARQHRAAWARSARSASPAPCWPR